MSTGLPDSQRRSWIVPVAAVVALSMVLGFVVWNTDRGEHSSLVVVLPEISVPDPEEVYDPVKEGSDLPDGFRQILRRDQIEPVYHPEFTDADDVDWPEESLVVGVAGDSTAKAYPITHLNQHEMVLDDIEGIPILVSW